MIGLPVISATTTHERGAPLYDGLAHKSTVCSGYASLSWRMCSAAAIPCRIVTGTGKFEAHAWNMVQLDAYW
jgi:transglutaminase/protease-like cytokinesis protein 3